MSADNWTSCPKCKARYDSELQDLVDTIDRSYGKVSREEFKSLEDRLFLRRSETVADTLREDYEIGMGRKSGLFYISYGAQCEAVGCGFEFSFQQEMDPHKKV